MENITRISVFKQPEIYPSNRRNYAGYADSILVQARVLPHMGIKQTYVIEELKWITLHLSKDSLLGDLPRDPRTLNQTEIWVRDGSEQFLLELERSVSVGSVSYSGYRYTSPCKKYNMYSKTNGLYVDFLEEAKKGCILVPVQKT